MADHGEKAILVPGLDSCRERSDTESCVCEYGTVVFRGSLYMLGE